MPYSSTVVKLQAELAAEDADYGSPDPVTGLYPLVRESQKPEACRRLRCKMEFFREGVMKDEHGEVAFSLIRQDVVAWAHTFDGQTDIYDVPISDLEDVSKEIWAPIRSWMAGLHDEVSR